MQNNTFKKKNYNHQVLYIRGTHGKRKIQLNNLKSKKNNCIKKQIWKSEKTKLSYNVLVNHNKITCLNKIHMLVLPNIHQLPNLKRKRKH